MIRRSLAERDGNAAVEFALVAPVLIALFAGVIALGAAMWKRNALQQAATEAARCVAVGGSACTIAASTCGATDQRTCYVQQLAAKRGVSDVSADQIAFDTFASYGGVTFTRITIVYPFTLLGYTTTLRSSGHFPNQNR